MAEYSGEVGVVYAVITDFSLQYQRSEKTGTELGKPYPSHRLGVAVVTQIDGTGGAGPVPVAVLTLLAPARPA
mgnify:CR=1 FL=1